MGDSGSHQPDRRLPEPTQGDAAPEEFGFGGEPAELAAHPLTWDTKDHEATRISKTPPIVPAHIEPMRPTDYARSLVGQRLEHFELKELVGGGGMGAVFRATDTRLNRTVAIKVLPRDHAADDEVVRRFRNEAQSAARLDHDNVARVYYVGEDKGLHFIAFEFIEGKNLRDVVVERGPLPVADALSYTLQIADALAHAADRDVVHRDIKPSNVLIASDGRAKLVDMGLARLHQIEKSSEDLTASGVTLGTFDYISPEQARDPRSADARSDIYSLGCTLFFMLTGRPPFPEGTVLQKLLQHQADEAPDPREFNAAVPLELVRVLRRMMAKDPRQRQQSPEELVGELALLANQWGIRTSSGESLLVASELGEPSFLERHIVWMLPVAALLLVFAVLRITSMTGSGLLTSWLRSTDSSEYIAADAPSGPEPAGPPPPAPRAVIRSNDIAPSPVQEPITPNRSISESDEGAAPEANPIRNMVDAVSDAPSQAREGEAVDPNRAFASESSVADAMPPQVATIDQPLPYTVARASASDPATGLVSTLPAPAPPPGIAQGVLIVAAGETGDGVFPNLQAACLAAESDDVIELRYQGRQEVQPIDLRNMNLTIRAGQGYKPVVLFRPRETESRVPSRAMISATGGRLMLVNVALEFELPLDVPSQGWSLLRLQQAESLQIERCSLTVRNLSQSGDAFHDDVAIVRVVAPPGGGSMLAPEEYNEPVSIQLRDCLVRGEADLLVQEDAQPCQFTWANGLASLNGHFVVSQSARRLPPARDRLKLELTHLTVDARDGLCKLSNTIDAPYQVNTEMRVSNSILLGDDLTPMISQSGVDTARELRSRFKWEGTRNFYDGYKTFWRVQGRDMRDEPQLAEAADWMTFLRGEKPRGRVIWRGLPDDGRPAHSLAPADYALDETAANNPAVKGASDGRDAGCDLMALPDVPAGSDRFSRAPAVDTSRRTRIEGSY